MQDLTFWYSTICKKIKWCNVSNVHAFVLGPDDALFTVMESICHLVDTIPDHELIALTCGTELLLQRAHR